MNTADQYLKTIYVLQQAHDSPASASLARADCGLYRYRRYHRPIQVEC
jgi:hypothetical protein